MTRIDDAAARQLEQLGKVDVVAPGDTAQGRRVRLEVGGDRARFEGALSAAGFPCGPDRDGRLTVRLDGRAEDADELFAIAAGAGALLRSIEEVRSSLEQVFVAGVGAEEPE